MVLNMLMGLHKYGLKILKDAFTDNVHDAEYTVCIHDSSNELASSCTAVYMEYLHIKYMQI